MADVRTLRNREREPRGQKQGPDLEGERQAFRELIDKFRREPETDEGGFYRNVGRFIVRTMMKSH